MVGNGESLEFRLATHADVIFVAQLVREFYRKSGSVYGIPFDYESAIRTVEECIDDGICIIGPSSCAGAIITPFPYNRRIRVAQVLFWYFRDPKEVRVFDALWVACIEIGAHRINAATIAPEGVGKNFYQRRGMTLAECHHIGGFIKPLQKVPKAVIA